MVVGARNLVFTDFFFWKPGSPLQKSLDGLYRGLLHRILLANQELLPELFPDQWSHLQFTPWQLRTETKIRPQEIRTAFKRLIGNQSIYRTHCFCFFLDGLDEHEPVVQEDFSSVVRMLNS